MSLSYVIERPELAEDGQMLAGSMLRAWKNGRPLEALRFDQLSPKPLKEARFCLAMGDPDQSLSPHANWPSRLQPLGQALQTLGGRGWKAYLAQGVFTLSYGKDKFFSIPTGHGLDHAVSAIDLAFRQSPPGSGQVFLFEAKDDTDSSESLASVFQGLGLRVKPLQLGSGPLDLMGHALKNAPKGLPSGVALLAVLLGVSLLWQPHRTSPASSLALQKSSAKSAPAVSAISALEDLLNPLVAALGAAGGYELEKITIASGAAPNQLELEVQILAQGLQASPDLKSVRDQLSKLPGVLSVNVARDVQGSLKLSVASRPNLSFSSQGAARSESAQAASPQGLDQLRSKLEIFAKQSAVVTDDLQRVSPGRVVMTLPEQPIRSVLTFLGQLASSSANLDLNSLKITRGIQPGLLTAVIEFRS
jgi:hypothetical protein